MKIPDSIFAEIIREGYYQKYPDLLLIDIPNYQEKEHMDWRLSKLGLTNLMSECSVFINAKGLVDIPLNTEFNILFSVNALESYLEIKAKLIYVNVNRQREIDYLPSGYTGTCLFNFDDVIPPILSKLAIYGEKRDLNKTEMFYLTQRPLLDRILELINR